MEKEEKKIDVSAVKKDVKEVADAPKLRQIIIETDGNSVNLVKAEVSGLIELIGILTKLIEYFNKQK